VYHVSRSPSLANVRLARLRPTQLTVGYIEVTLKAREWARCPRRSAGSPRTACIPGGARAQPNTFIIDHHHLGIALIDEGIKDVVVAVLDDLSWLETPVFWRTMEYRSWSHPYDRRGRRCDYGDMPRRLTQLEDDPYRSLAGLVRRAGGYAKDSGAIRRVPVGGLFPPAGLGAADQARASARHALGLRLAHSSEARYLPGWTGKVSSGAVSPAP
jgi:hypothetical protein